MEWQLLETQKGRQKCLLWSPPIRGLKGEIDVGYINKDYIGNPEYKYTHWMPLPEPPQIK